MRKLVTLSISLGALQQAYSTAEWSDFDHVFGSTAMSKFSHTDMDPSGSNSDSCFLIESELTGYSKLDVTRWIPSTAFGTVGAMETSVPTSGVGTRYRQERWLEGDTDTDGHMLATDALTKYFPVVSIVPLQLRNISVTDSTDNTIEEHQLQTYVPHPLANSGEANLVDYHETPVPSSNMKDEPWRAQRLGDFVENAYIENMIEQDTVSFQKPRSLAQATCVGVDFASMSTPSAPSSCLGTDTVEYNTMSASPIIVDERFGDSSRSHDCRPKRYATPNMIRSLQKLSSEEIFGREFDPEDENIPCVSRTDDTGMTLWSSMNTNGRSETVPFANKYGEHVCRDYFYPTARVWANAGGTGGVLADEALYVSEAAGVYSVLTDPYDTTSVLGTCDTSSGAATLTFGGLTRSTTCSVAGTELTFHYTTRDPADELKLTFTTGDSTVPVAVDSASKISLYVYLDDIGESVSCDHTKYGDQSTKKFTSGWPLMRKHVAITTRDECDYGSDTTASMPTGATDGLCITYESEAPLVAWTSYGVAKSLSAAESTWGFPGDGAVSPGYVDYTGGKRWNVYRKDSDEDRQVESQYTRDIAFAVYEDWVAADDNNYLTSPDTQRVRQSIQTHNFQLNTTVYPDEITELEASFEARAALFDASLRTIRPVFKYSGGTSGQELAFIEFEVQLDIDTTLMPPSSLDVEAVRLIRDSESASCVIESEAIQQYPDYSSAFEFQRMALTIDSDDSSGNVEYDSGMSSTTLKFALLPALGSDSCTSAYSFTDVGGDMTLDDLGDFKLEILFDVVSYLSDGDGTFIGGDEDVSPLPTLSWTDFNTNTDGDYDIIGTDGRFSDGTTDGDHSYVESAFSIEIAGVPFDAVLPAPTEDTQTFTWNTIDYTSRVTGLKYAYTNMQEFSAYQDDNTGAGATIEGAGHDAASDETHVPDLSDGVEFDPYTGFAHNWGSQFSVASCAANADIFDLDLVHAANGNSVSGDSNNHFAERLYHVISEDSSSAGLGPEICDLVTYGLTEPVVGPSASYMDFELTYTARTGELHNSNVHQLATWICATTKDDSMMNTVAQSLAYTDDFPCGDAEVPILLQASDIEYVRRATREKSQGAGLTPEQKYLEYFFYDGEIAGDADADGTAYVSKLGSSTIDLRAWTQYDYSLRDDSRGINRLDGDRDVYPEICDRDPDLSDTSSSVDLEGGVCKRTNSTFDQLQYTRQLDGTYKNEFARDLTVSTANPMSESEYTDQGSDYEANSASTNAVYSDPLAYADPSATRRGEYPDANCLARMNLMHMRSVASGDHAMLDPAVCMSMDTYINSDGDEATVKGRIHVSDARFSRAFDGLTIKTRLALDLDEYAADDGAAFGNEDDVRRRRLLQTVEEVTTQVSLSAQYVADADLGNCASTSTDGAVGTDGSATTEPCGSGCGDGLELSEVSGSTIVCAVATSVTTVSDDEKTKDRFNDLELMLFIILGCVLLLLMMVMFIDIDLNRGELRFCGRIRALPAWMCRPCRETKEQKLERLRRNAARHGMKLVAGQKGRVAMWG